MRRSADVVVVGGGPAGSATAILLARAGLKVCLLEKGRYPREKACGEYLSPGCIPLLRRLGVLSAVEASQPHPIRGMRIAVSEGTVVTATYPGNGAAPHGYALPRYRLDPVLFEAARAAGVECREGWRVVEVMRDGGRVVGVTADCGGRQVAVTASVTIGADGRSSVVARRLGLFAWHPSHRKVALLQRFASASDRGDLGAVYLGGAGYCILNPQSAGVVNVGLVVDHRDLPLHRAWEDVFRELLAAFPGVWGVVERARPLNALRVLGPLACRAKRVAGDGFLLVGDAAGYYDPMTGEGVYQALKGAELAAQVVTDVLSNRDPGAEALGRYAIRYRREFAPKERACELLQRIVRHPRLCQFLMQRLVGRGAQAEELMGVVGDLFPPERLLHPRFWLGLLLGGSLDSA